MPLAKSYCISLLGISGTVIEVEADISSNLPGFVLVGLPDASLSESSARVKAATSNSGLQLPARKLTVNLSPASVPKYGSIFDLAIAIAALAAGGLIKNERIAKTVFLGELGLDGSVRPVAGVLPAVMLARNAGFEYAVVPQANLNEARLVESINTLGVSHLTQLARHYGASVAEMKANTRETVIDIAEAKTDFDISDIHGQDAAIDALVVAATGGHHLLMVGSPGVGKTMLAERFSGLLPDLTLDQSLETTAIHSVSRTKGHLGSNLISRPPFEAPHHSASVPSLVGGGIGLPSPGLISLAHNGVLFLDEAPEFQTPALESLRQSLESGTVTIARSVGVAKFPAKFQLILAANPCPCGQALNVSKTCTCAAMSKAKYLNKLSGPLLDRVDIRLQIRGVNAAQIALAKGSGNRKTSALARTQVTEARALLSERLKKHGYRKVSEVPASQLKKVSTYATGSLKFLDMALMKQQISMRGYDRCLRLALSISALEGRDYIAASDIDKAQVLRGTDNLLAVEN